MSDTDIDLFKGFYFPPEMASEITGFLPIAAMYPTDIKREIERRSNIPDDTLVYEYDDYYFDYHVKAGEIITKVVIRKGDEIIASTDANDVERSYEYVTNIDCICIRGKEPMIRGQSGIITLGEYITSLLDDWMLKTVSLSLNIDTFKYNPRKHDKYMPEFIRIAETNHPDSTIKYPNKLTIYLKRQTLKNRLGTPGKIIVDTNILSKCFEALYQLATVNKYWMPETFFLLNAPVKNLGKFKLIS